MTMTVLVKLNESNQELISDLARLAPRARAERVRVLAMLGLMAMKGGGRAVAMEAEDEAMSAPPPAAGSAKDKLKGRLRGSLA